MKKKNTEKIMKKPTTGQKIRYLDSVDIHNEKKKNGTYLQKKLRFLSTDSDLITNSVHSLEPHKCTQRIIF